MDNDEKVNNDGEGVEDDIGGEWQCRVSGMRPGGGLPRQLLTQCSADQGRGRRSSLQQLRSNILKHSTKDWKTKQQTNNQRWSEDNFEKSADWSQGVWCLAGRTWAATDAKQEEE